MANGGKIHSETVKPQRIAIIHDKQQYGEGLARSVQDGLKAANANVVFFDGITAGEKDFSALIARLKKKISTSFTTAVTTRKWGRCCAGPFCRPDNPIYGAGRCG